MAKATVALTPVGRKVIIKPLDPTKETDFGIVIPPSARDTERPNKGEVISVGPLVGTVTDDKKSESGVKIKKGMNVLFSKYSPTEIEFEGEKYLIINESDILAIIE